MNHSVTLHRLQLLDIKIDQLDHQISCVNNELNDETRIRSALQEFNDHAAAQRGQEAKLAGISAKTTAIRLKIEQSESSLYSGGIKNPKELHDLQNEIKSLRKILPVLEDEELDVMVSLEEVQRVTTKSRENYESAVAHKISHTKDLQIHLEELLKDRDRTIVERDATKISIPQKEMLVYDHLRQTKAGIAVVDVVDYNCSTCGAEVSKSEWQNARTNPALVFCQGCGRILYCN